MSDESPTLSEYEEAADVEFDLEDQLIERAAIDAELERLSSS